MFFGKLLPSAASLVPTLMLCYALAAQVPSLGSRMLTPATLPTTSTAIGVHLELGVAPDGTNIIIAVTNRSEHPIKLDGALIYGFNVIVEPRDGKEARWEELSKSPDLKPLANRIVLLQPKQRLTRVISLTDGFDYFSAARGSFSRGGAHVDVTVAGHARHRLTSDLADVDRIAVVYRPGDMITKDGFTYCVGESPEMVGLELATVGPAVLSLPRE